VHDAPDPVRNRGEAGVDVRGEREEVEMNDS
jgi:hypothetical protein